MVGVSSVQKNLPKYMFCYTQVVNHYNNMATHSECKLTQDVPHLKRFTGIYENVCLLMIKSLYSKRYKLNVI